MVGRAVMTVMPTSTELTSRAAASRLPGTCPDAGRSPIKPQQCGNDGRRQRPVADVLIGERRLVHRGAHVPRIHGIHVQIWILHRQGAVQMVQRRLGGTVSTPAWIVLDGCVGGDPEHRPAGRTQSGQQCDGQRQRRLHVDRQDPGELRRRQVHQGGKRRRAERAGVVHQQIQVAARGDLGHQVGAVRVVGDVTGDHNDAGPGCKAGPSRLERTLAASIEDQVPAVVSQRPGQFVAEPEGRPGDECERHDVLPPVESQRHRLHH